MMNIHDPIAALLGPWASELCTLSILLRVALSVLFSSLVGCERAVKRHAAGLRTFIVVSRVQRRGCRRHRGQLRDV